MTKKSKALLEQPADLNQFTVVKRNGTLVPFRSKRIYHAIEAAFRDTKKVPKNEPLPEEISQIVSETSNLVVQKLAHFASKGTCLTVEGIQDVVEVTLMKQGHHDVARDYIIYRDQHKQLRDDSPQNFRVTRKDGTNVRFNPMKIAATIEQAFRSSQNIDGPSPQSIIDAVNLLTQKVVSRAASTHKESIPLTTALIQDEVENQLMREGFFSVAKELILQRAGIGQPIVAPKEEEEEEEETTGRNFTVVTADQKSKSISEKYLRKWITHACRGLEKEVLVEDLLNLCILNFYEGIKETEVDMAIIMAARSNIEKDPAYSNVASRLLLDVLYRETMEITSYDAKLKKRHREYFKSYIKHGIAIDRLSPKLEEFDLDRLADAMDLAAR